ncbi:MAG: hypothetical protein NVS9B9_30790 [Ktedonobacteraceae bacterium]
MPQIVFVDENNHITEKKDVPLIEMLPEFPGSEFSEVELMYS